MDNTKIVPQIQDQSYLGINDTAEKLEQVLNSENVSDDTKNIILGILDFQSFEKGLTFNDPRIIRNSFPFLIDSIGIEKGRTLLQVLQSALNQIGYEEKTNSEVQENG